MVGRHELKCTGNFVDGDGRVAVAAGGDHDALGALARRWAQAEPRRVARRRSAQEGVPPRCT